MKRMILLVAYLVIANQSVGQSIHRNDLNCFQGSIVVKLSNSGGVIPGFTEFESKCQPQMRSKSRSDYSGNQESELCLSYYDSLAPAYAFPSGSLVVIPLQDHHGHEIQNHVLSFWQARGDSLGFAFFDSSVRRGAIGYLAVRQVLESPNSELYLLTENYGNDAGDIWGKFDIALVQPESKIVTSIANERYHWEYMSTACDSLQADLVLSPDGVAARFIRTHLSWDEVSRRGKVTSVDTTYVELSEQ